MQLNELIAELTKLQVAGHGESLVVTYSSDSGETYGVSVNISEASGDEYPYKVAAGKPVILIHQEDSNDDFDDRFTTLASAGPTF